MPWPICFKFAKQEIGRESCPPSGNITPINATIAAAPAELSSGRRYPRRTFVVDPFVTVSPMDGDSHPRLHGFSPMERR